MNNRIPPATAKKLLEEHPPGTRHKAAVDIAVPLIGDGKTPDEVFRILRDAFPEEKTDEELLGIIRWAVNANPSPSGYGSKTKQYNPVRSYNPPEKKLSPIEHTEWWTGGAKVSVDDFSKRSGIAIPASQADALILALELLYTGPENLNLVCAFEMSGEKARPSGPGRILSRDKWVEYIREKSVPDSKAGCWFRPNPVKEKGSGAAGAITDSDVVAFRFLLVESDALPIDTQLGLYSKLKLPIAAVLMSGGISAHAWVRVDCKTIDEYEMVSRKILTALEPFGIDQGNKNPSRLSRLPGAFRSIGAKGDGCQKLLWLNPGKQALTESGIMEFEESLLLPAVEEKPFRTLILEAIPRYQDMMDNRGRLGVQLGFRSFDKVSGGLKPGGYTLIAAQTGTGKTTLAINIMNHALKNKTGIVLFSLEMPRDYVTDMMFSLNCNVDRNHFNTGYFTDEEIQRMTSASGWMKDIPLWVDDDPSVSMDKIRRRVLQLRSEGRIGLAVLDYAQLALPDGTAASREQAVASIALGLRLLCRDAKIPMIVLSQLNDDNRVRESRKLAHEAENLFILERDSVGLEDPNMTLRIVKGRKIPSNPIKLHMDARFCRITERGPIETDDLPAPWSTPYRAPSPDV